MKTGIEETARVIVDSAIRIHRALGPGLLESAYQACLAYELRSADLEVRCEVPLPVRYREVLVDAGYRVDMLINEPLAKIPNSHLMWGPFDSLVELARSG